jgi:catechol 2,3-dioxygenase-like lactoylglutathione lyase family enzyme
MDDPLPTEAPPAGGLRRTDFLKRAAVAGAGMSAAAALIAAERAAAVDIAFPPGETPTPERGLRAHINRFSHLVINVSDLERAREFYEATFPVTVTARTNGPPQPFRSLGIKRGQFDGYMLNDASEFPSRAIHIVEWKSPGPVGTPYGEANHNGFYRTAALTPDIQARHQAVIAAGSTPYGPPSPIPVGPAGATATAFGFPDPDGSTLEWIAVAAGAPERLSHQNANARDLRKSFPFYQRVVGLDHNIRPFSPEPFDQTLGSLGRAIRNPDGTLYEGLVDFDAPFFSYRADGRNPIDLLQWELPGVFGRPYPVPNHLGIIRLAFEVDDIEAAHHKLRKAWHRVAGPPEEWDMGEFGTRKVVIFEDPDGIMLELIERPPYGIELNPVTET